MDHETLIQIDTIHVYDAAESLQTALEEMGL